MALSEIGFLSPFRVLDLTDELGFLCGKILGDLGADVIKIEKPGGDPSRNIGPFFHNQIHPEKSLYWFAFNNNKRGITLNLETSRGRDLFCQLAAKSDFIIESFSPGYLDGIQLGYTALSRLNPRVILTSITPFGQTGPYSRFKRFGYRDHGHERDACHLRGIRPGPLYVLPFRNPTTGRAPTLPWGPW